MKLIALLSALLVARVAAAPHPGVAKERNGLQSLAARDLAGIRNGNVVARDPLFYRAETLVKAGQKLKIKRDDDDDDDDDDPPPESEVDDSDTEDIGEPARPETDSDSEIDDSDEDEEVPPPGPGYDSDGSTITDSK